MAFFGKSDATLNKPYLGMLKEKIENKEPIKCKLGEYIFTITPDIKRLFKIIDDSAEHRLASVLGKSGHPKPIFATKEGNIFKWNDIDKEPFSKMGGSSKSDAKTTKKQEDASLIAIEEGIKANGFKDMVSFKKQCQDKIKKVYPEVDDIWMEGFFQQQKTVVSQVGSTPFSEYSRDKGFMNEITKYVKDQYGITNKDTWDPADIWLVNDSVNVRKKLFKKIKDSTTNIAQFNTTLQGLFTAHKVIGISLKKISGKEAKWELVNMDKVKLSSSDNQFKVTDIRCDFSTKGSTDTIITAQGLTGKVTLQIRQNSKGLSNLKIEGTDKSATKARLGKAPLDMVKLLFKSYNTVFENDNKKYPHTAAEFTKVSKKYKSVFDNIKNKISTKTKSPEFIKEMLDLFNKKPDVGMSKLQQLVFINILYKTDVDECVTSIIYLCMKKGDIFGPFGKLY